MPDKPNGATRPEDAVTLRWKVTDTEDRRRRIMALALALASALVLLPSIFLGAFLDWVWFPVGLGSWLAVMLTVSGIVTYRHGPKS
jgi:fatty acid desaturase